MRKPVEPYWISGVFFRPWTVYLSAAFVKLGVSANAVTAISGVSLALAALFLAQDDRLAWVAGGFLALLYFSLDHCDGEVARYRAIAHGRPGGPEGVFWDGVAHGLAPLLIVAVGYRLMLEGSFGAWPMILAALGVTAQCVAPWQRCCEAALAWSSHHRREAGAFHLPASFMIGGDDESGPAPSFVQKVKQLVLFPGTFVTLPIAAFLDAALGPIALGEHAGRGPDGLVLHWVGLWLLQICAGSILASVNGSLRHARRLRSLPAERPAKSDD